MQEGLGASLFATELCGDSGGRPEAPIMDLEKVLCGVLVDWAANGSVSCMHDVSEGGFAFALAEMCLESQCGLQVDIEGLDLGTSSQSRLFGEFPGVVIIGVEQGQARDVERSRDQNLCLARIGATTTSGVMQIERNGSPLLEVQTSDIATLFEAAIPSIMTSNVSAQ